MGNIIYSDLSELRSISRIKDFEGEYQKMIGKIDKIFFDNPDCTPIFIAIVGSTSYGIDTETSDLDAKVIYLQSTDCILSDLSLGATPYKYKKQIITNKGDSTIKEDIACYEIARYLDLLMTNNPNILELRHVPKYCVVYKHPIWDHINNQLEKEQILTKKCYYTFYNYAEQQILKATGLHKKINNPIEEKRKSPLDFCHIIEGDGRTLPLREFLHTNKIDQKLCGLKKVDHARDTYILYIDHLANEYFSCYLPEVLRKESELNKKEISGKCLKYRGIIKENEDNEEVSNEIRLSSIPKNEKPLCMITYNKDGYLTYCKKYREYWGVNGWMELRNEDRYNDNISGGQNYDGKNIGHCVRLLYMAIEIAEGKGIIVRRTADQRDEILAIKKGKVSYDEVMEKCNNLKAGLKKKYEKSNLPDSVSEENLSKILLWARKNF